MEAWTTIAYDESGNLIGDTGLPTEAAPAKKAKTKKAENDIISLKQFKARIPDEAAAIAFAESAIWGDEPRCGHCASENVYPVKSKKPQPWKCRTCKKYFSVRIGTVMQDTNIQIRDWLLAIYFIHSSRKGMSSHQLSRHLGIGQQHAWHLGHRIRAAMREADFFVCGVVQMDETYVGGKAKNIHASKKKKPGWDGMANKMLVLGFRDDSGHVISFPIADNTQKTIEMHTVMNVEPDSTIYTDSHSGYANLSEYGFDHHWVNHKVGEFVRGMVTTNGIESFWALLKRGYVGTFHVMSAEHLHRYISEFAYRHNAGKGNGFATMERVLRRMVGKRLTWETLTR